MKIYNLKKLSIPKVAVLATGLAAGVMVVTINPSPAQAFPGQTAACTGCHAAGGSVTATPSNAALAPGAPYTVALAFTGGAGGSVGYWISGEGGNFNGSSTTAAMTAPAAAGTYTYTVWMRDGVTSSTTYAITVGVAATTPPVTTTTPPVTTTTPPVTTTTPPVTTTTPPVTTEPPVTTTTPPVTTEPPVTTTTPPVTTEPPVVAEPAPGTSTISSLSPTHGTVGSKVQITGSDLGTAGSVKFGKISAKVSSWTSTSIVVRVPAQHRPMVSLSSDSTMPIWYRHGGDVSVTVTPKGAAASTAVTFHVDSRKGHGHHSKHDDGHHTRHAGDMR